MMFWRIRSWWASFKWAAAAEVRAHVTSHMMRLIDSITLETAIDGVSPRHSFDFDYEKGKKRKANGG